MKDTMDIINAQSAPIVDYSGFAQVLTDMEITGTAGEYSILTDSPATLRPLDTAMPLYFTGLVSAFDNEVTAEAAQTAFLATVAADIGTSARCFFCLADIRQSKSHT